MQTKITRYGNRNWAVWLTMKENGVVEDELVAVTVYKKGAESVCAITDALIKTRQIIGH